jgi:hypothetical protein
LVPSFGGGDDGVDQMLEYASDEIHLVSKEDFKRLLGYEEPFLEEWLLSKCGSLDKKERSDYADVSTGRILRRNEEFVPNHLSREYVAYLEGKEKRATVCKEKQLLEHQRSVLARAQVQ